MKQTLWLLLAALLGASPLAAQVVVAEGVQLNAQPTPAASGGLNWQIVGGAGATTRYYWVSAVYPQGETRFSGPLIVTNSPAALGAGNFVQIVWWNQPGALSYNVVCTATTAYPVTGAILVANVTAPANQTRDTGAALGAYTTPPWYAPTSYLLDTRGRQPYFDTLHLSDLNNTLIVDARGKYPTIQAAVNACPATGCTVYLPTGVYNLPLELDITTRRSVRLLGAGRGATAFSSRGTTIAAATTMVNLLHVLNSNEIEVEGINFDLNNNAATGIRLDSDNVVATTNVTFRDCTFTGAPNDGVHFRIGQTSPANAQIDAIYIYSSLFSSTTGRTGVEHIHIEDSNARLYLNGVNFEGPAIYAVNQLGGIVHIQNMQETGSTTAIFHVGNQWGLSVVGARLEGNAPLLFTENIAGSNSQSIFLADVDHARSAGTLSLHRDNDQSITMIGCLTHDIQNDSATPGITLINHRFRAGSGANPFIGASPGYIANLFQLPRTTDAVDRSALNYSNGKFGIFNGVAAATPADELHLVSANPSLRFEVSGGTVWRFGAGEDTAGRLTFKNLTTGRVVWDAYSTDLVDFYALGIGGGPGITKHLSATASLDFTALNANTCEVLTITVTGAADGNTVTLGIPNALADVDGAIERTVFFGWVSAANTVSVRRCNVTAAATANPAAANVRADVWQH